MSNIIGGTPTGDGDALIDASSAVLLENVNVVKIGAIRKGELDPVIGLELGGRINKSTERLSTLYLLDGEGAAAIVAELVELAVHISPQFFDLLMARLERAADARTPGAAFRRRR